MNGIQAFLNQLKDQGIDITLLKPSNLTEEHIKNNVILYMRNFKGSRIGSYWNFFS
ncbi:hypothetical protein [Metabacillus hrfriensis]|uniref:Uncharacterized protein n=1 Tax=Metabacillus hrfriensis TaxID=3048891 RepID=A0ACD4RID5_9BACI|nr:hypothetical protein [Metabacillus sp. CT-WN-B3]WHZ60147.1 hypothetical protein QLQ22_03665 [Metabacillus sp. CT-WN-B3]